MRLLDKMRRGALLLVIGIGLALGGTTVAQVTYVAIDGTKFRIAGSLTYPGTVAEGLLLNSRMANAIFDDENPSTVGKWAYPDTGLWDAERNLSEFIAALPSYADKGLRAININLQGGNPVPGCSCDASHTWITSAYHSDGSLKAAWMSRADRAITAAGQHGIVVMLGLFYHGQDQRLASEAALKRAVDEVTDWVLTRGHENVMLEIANESNHALTSFDIVKNRVEELIARAQTRSGGRLAVSSGFLGGWVPSDKVVAQSDYVILHGNGKNASGIQAMVDQVRAKAVYQADPKPIIFNEDSTSIANLDAAVGRGASWGYHDPAFQVVPVNWTINTSAKRAFFDRVAFYRGSPQPTLSFTPSVLTFESTQDGAISSRTVAVQASSGTPSFAVSDDAAWLSVSPQAGSAPASLTVSANPAGLSQGSYTGAVTAKATGYTNATIMVTLIVQADPGPSGYSLRVSPSASRTSPVELNGQTTSGSIYVFTGPDTSVLQVHFYLDDPGRTGTPYRIEGAPPFDLGGGTVTAAKPFDTRTLHDGSHLLTAALKLSSGVVEVVTATFLVDNAARSLVFTPASLSFGARQGDPALTQSVSLRASDNGSPAYTVTDSSGWLSVSPSSGTLPASLVVRADPGLAPGTYNASVTATGSNYPNATLPVTLTVTASSGSAYRLMVSGSADRSNPVDLDGRAVSGLIYVFTGPDAGVSTVSFYVDDPDRVRSAYRVEKTAPFDLGGGDVALAKPFDTSSLQDGQHTLTARLQKTDGTADTLTATFAIDN